MTYLKRACSVLFAFYCVMLSSTEAQFLQQGGKLVGTGAVGTSSQGRSVSISADGNTAIVGGTEDSLARGAAWVYARNAGVWIQEGSKLVGTGVVGNAQQGQSVSISGDGNTAIVGGPYDNSGAGAAWIYTRSSGSWSQQGAKIVGTGAVGTANQGYSAAISSDGNTAIVGGYLDASSTGAAWVFTRTAGIWSQQGGKLVGTGGIGNSLQGYSIALSADGNTAALGGYWDNNSIGAIWVFTRNGGVWSQQGSKLVGTGAIGSANQGYSVALSADGNKLMVGGISDNSNEGATWIFSRIAGVWSQEGGKIVGSGAIGDALQGASVSLSSDGRTAIMGGFGDNGGRGTTWIFTLSGSVWSQQGSKNVGTDASGIANQGASVCISGDGYTAIVGGYSDNAGAGAAWVYTQEKTGAIISIRDLPNDQGGSVRIRWKRSVFDSSGVANQTTSYGVWRRIPLNYASTSYKRTAPPQEMLVESDSLSQYDYLMTVNAVQIPVYNIVVPTLDDSSAGGVPYFTYLITTHSADPNAFFISGSDSGYSVDNIAPIPPLGLSASLKAGSKLEISWASPSDYDVRSFTIFRSTVSGFIPSPACSVGISFSTNVVDSSLDSGVIYYYRLVAEDIHDNVSLPSDELPASVSGIYQFPVQDKWNMVSVPLEVSDYDKTVLFPMAASAAYTFEGGYFGYSVLENGRGYWMKYAGGRTISMTGVDRLIDTIAAVDGWNMVGSLSSSFPITSITSIPSGMVTSNFFGYDHGYQSVSVLEPGMGYWVKVSGDGKLIFRSGGVVSPVNQIRIEDTGEKPPAPPSEEIVMSGAKPTLFSLNQNYPNPFNPTTQIHYGLAADAVVTVKVYNTLGQEVASLIDGFQTAGYHEVRFDGSGLASGLYFYRLQAGSFKDAKKLMLLK